LFPFALLRLSLADISSESTRFSSSLSSHPLGIVERRRGRHFHFNLLRWKIIFEHLLQFISFPPLPTTAAVA
jgi:hypothetical protein